MGYVTKRGNSYQATYRDQNGRERTKTFRLKREAEAFLTKIDHDRLLGVYLDPVRGRVTFREYAEAWRTIQIHRPGTARAIENRLRVNVYPVIGDRPISAIRQSEVQQLLAILNQRFAPNTVRTVMSMVASVFKAAMQDQLIGRNPCTGLRLPGVPAQEVSEVLTAEQVFTLAEAMPERYRALVLTGAGTGLRPSELFGLSLDRVDFLRRQVRVDRQLAGVGRRWSLVPPKTASSVRTVPLPDVVALELSQHLKRFDPGPELLLFTAPDGEPTNFHRLRWSWQAARSRAGIPDWVTMHDLRHFYASALIRAGLSVKVVQVRLGHASATTTLNTYTHLWPDDEDRTRSAIDAELRVHETREARRGEQ